MLPAGSVVHFSCIAGHAEDEGTVRYLMDTALQAGLQARFVAIDDIGYDAVDGCFVDADNHILHRGDDAGAVPGADAALKTP